MKNELEVKVLMSKDDLPMTNSDQVVYALAKIQAGPGAVTGGMPANFALVLDRSGSMDGEKMDKVKEAAGYAIDHLNDRDLVSITIFDDQVETLVPSGPARDRGSIKDKLAGVIARGGTQISDGLKAGLSEVMKGYVKDRVNRILLLTDGQTWDDEERCLALAEEAGKQGIAITSIGIGHDWNEKLLLKIAEASHGDSHWIEDPSAILDVFRQEVEGLRFVAATNLRVTARMSPGATPLRVYSTIPMIADVSKRAVNGSTVAADLGTLDGKDGQALLIEARVKPQHEGRFRVGQVEVTYDIPEEQIKGLSVRTDFFVAFSHDAVAGVNAEVMNLVEKVTAFKLQTRALTEAEAGNILAATQKLEAAATVFLDLGEVELAEAAEQEALSLKKTGALTSAGTKKLEYGTRKLTRAMTTGVGKS